MSDEVIIIPIKTFMYIGNSMVPQFFDGDIVDIGIYHTVDEVEIGDIIVTKSLSITGNKHVCHRIIEITETGKIKTKGDNNSGVDSWELNFEDIEGKIINADRPQRIKRYFIHNQYSKQSREIIEQIIEQNNQERDELQGEINRILEELKITPEYIALFESEMWADYLSNMANLQQAEENFEAGVITEEQIEIDREEFHIIAETVTTSQIYTDYFALPGHAELQQASLDLRLFEYDMIRIVNDSSEIRGEHRIIAFPVGVLEIPEYLNWNSQKVACSKKCYHNLKDLNKYNIWQEAFKDNIKRLIGTEKVSI